MHVKKLLSALIAIMMIITIIPATAIAKEGDEIVELSADGVAATQYTVSESEGAADFFNALQGATNATVTLLSDVSVTGAYIPVQEGQTITLDFNGHILSKADNSMYAPIENYGTMTIVDTSGEQAGGISGENRCVNNYGSMEIDAGRYTTTNTAGGTAIQNKTEDAVMTINDCEVNAGFYAFYNAGNATIEGGKFANKSCSACTPGSWAYTVVSEGTLYFNNGQVDGVQGAVAIKGGYAEIKDGEFYAHACETHGAGNAFYALYVAGEVQEVKCVVYDGKFTSEGKYAAALIGNDNTNGDGGINEKATSEIKGGTFTATVEDVPALKGAPKTGNPTITGGTFSSDITEYIPAGTNLTQDPTTGKVEASDAKIIAQANGLSYTSLQAAIDAAGTTAAEVTLVNDTVENITIAAGQDITLDLNGCTLTNVDGHTITNNGTLTVAGSGTVDNVVHIRAALYNSPTGNATILGGSFTRSREAGTYSPYQANGNSFYTIQNQGIMTIGQKDGDNSKIFVQADGGFSSLIANGYQDAGNKAEDTVDPQLTINGGSFSGGVNTVKNDETGILTINGGEFNNYVQHSLQNWNTATVNGGTFNASNTPALYNGKYGEYAVGDLTVTGGTFNAGTAKIFMTNIYSTAAKVSGGNFSAPVPQKHLDGVDTELYSTAVNAVAPYSYYAGAEAAVKAASDAKDTDAQVKILDTAANLTVTFNTNGGTLSIASITAKSGEQITLPAPMRNGYQFQGWSEGDKIYLDGDTYSITATTTLTAMWRDTSSGTSSGSSSSSGYTVSVDSGKNGSITVSSKRADRGDTVTITVKPDKGYELDDLTVTDKNGKEVKVTVGKNGKYTFTMPASKVTVEATFAKTGEALEHSFIDVPNGYWAEKEIIWAYENGYMNGNSAVTFNPDGTVTRQQLWMILARLSGQRPADFEEAKAWAVDNRVSDGTNPGGAVTRQQLVTILYRYAAVMGYKTSGSADLTVFPDHASVAAYAADAMSWSVANGIVGGTAQGTLNPTGTATRAQFAAILMRFVEKVVG